MLTQTVIRLHKGLVLLLLVIALVAVGFAHRAPSQTENAVTSLLLAGGSLADLCGDGDPGGAPHHGECLACQITAGADLPPASGTPVALFLAKLANVPVPRLHLVVPASTDPAHRPQGPPVA